MFGAYRETLLRDIFVIGTYDDRLGEKLLAEDESALTFELAVRKSEAFDRARQERASTKPTIAAVQRFNSYQSHPSGKDCKLLE